MHRLPETAAINVSETTQLIDHSNKKSKALYPKCTFITSIIDKEDLINDKTLDQSNLSEIHISEKQKSNNNTCSLIGGIICLIIAVIDWVTMSEVIQSSEQNNYNKPFLMRFVVNSGYSLMIIPWVCVHSINKRLVSNNMTFTHWRSPHNELQLSSAQTMELSFNNSVNIAELVINHKINKLHIFLSLIFVNLVSLSSGYIWYLSLSRTVASINNTIFQSNCVFVLIFSYLLLGEKMNFQKCFAAVIAVAGVALISYSTNTTNTATQSNSIIGIILCLSSMMLFAFFEVLFTYFGRKYFRFGYELPDTLLFQAGIGLCNLLLFWPFILLLDYTQFEIFQIPQTSEQLINGLLLPCFLDLLFTSSLLCGITFCGALFMSVGLILVIPIAFFADIIIFEKISVTIINAYSIAGAVCIVVGFIIIQINHNKHDRSDEKQE